MCFLVWRSGFLMGQPCICVLTCPSNLGGVPGAPLACWFNCPWSEQGLDGVSFHAYSMQHQIHTFFMHSHTLLILLLLWVVQLFKNSGTPHSLLSGSPGCLPFWSNCLPSEWGMGRAALCACFSTPYQLCPFSRWDGFALAQHHLTNPAMGSQHVSMTKFC